MEEDSNGELDGSKLGTLEYWDQSYEKELKNFNDFGDEGEIWFGYNSVKRVINWINSSGKIKKTHNIIDLGCGNGYTCFELSKYGYHNVLGIDYSPKAIDLARLIALKENLEIEYKVVDILNDKIIQKFDLCIDKGTYDAISLNPINPKEKRSLYKDFLKHIINMDGIFIITSCNWTGDELNSFFTETKDFELIDEIKPAQTFSYGGKSGSTTTNLVFKRTF